MTPSHPATKCFICLYRVGLGCRRIARLMRVSHKTAAKWVRRSGFKEAGRKGNLCRRVLAVGVKPPRNELRWMIGKGLACVWRPKKVVFTKEERKQRARISAARQWANRKHEPQFRLAKAMRLRVWKTIKRAGSHKSKHTKELIGCSSSELKEYLQSLFEKGMNWNNYGTAWEVDHIMPCDAFDLSNPTEQRKCFHFTNLRPLTKHQNRVKSWKRPAIHQQALCL